MKLRFATHNKGKFMEAKAILEPIGITLEQYDKGYPEIQSTSLEDVATYAANFLKGKIESPFFLEDAGLFIDALNGFPGVYSAYVFASIGCEGILKLLEDCTERDAHFESVIAYVENEDVRIFKGICKGEIAMEKRGNKGFGFDPIFIPNGSNKTFGEMEPEEKNVYSHRGKSIRKLAEYIVNGLA